jgi:hypothetical protein
MIYIRNLIWNLSNYSTPIPFDFVVPIEGVIFPLIPSNHLTKQTLVVADFIFFQFTPASDSLGPTILKCHWWHL